MRILGIDPGLATIGYGIVDKKGSQLSMVDYGIISTPKDETTPVRLAIIHEGMKKIIEKFNPDAVAVEELFFNTNVTTGIRVAEARGVLLLCGIMHCGNLFEYTPLQIKQTISGNGRADKHQMQFMVRTLLRLKEIPRPDDAADALAVAITHASMATLSARETV